MDLAEALRTTNETANPRTRGVFGGDHGMAFQEVIDFIEEYPVALISTVDSSGAPHVTGKGVVWTDDRLYFGAGENTAMGRNLRRDPRVALAFAEPPWKRHVLIRGAVRFVDSGGEEESRVNRRHAEVHGWGSGGIAEVDVSKVYTWKD